jgi:hypothetical protein
VAVRTFISRATSPATDAPDVRESMKYIPSGSAARTFFITRRSDVASDPMWLFMPRAWGTASMFSRVARAISSSDIEVRMALRPGVSFPRGCIGRWQRIS